MSGFTMRQSFDEAFAFVDVTVGLIVRRSLKKLPTCTTDSNHQNLFRGLLRMDSSRDAFSLFIIYNESGIYNSCSQTIFLQLGICHSTEGTKPS